MHLTKAETVIEMNRLGRLDWYKDTHTCYEGSDRLVANARLVNCDSMVFLKRIFQTHCGINKNKRLVIQIYRYKRKKKANSEIFQCGFFGFV